MVTNAQNAFAYEPLDAELMDVTGPSHASDNRSMTDEMASYAPNVTGHSQIYIDHEYQDSIPLQEWPEHNAQRTYDGHSTPLHTSRKRRYRYKSWKIGVVTAATTTTLVLLINCVFTTWMSIKYGHDGGIGTAYDGACDAVTAWSFWLHILINALSSILLSASNYTMQCITAPTRRECEIAHSRGDWLDVGVPSFRNLFRIGWQRRLMWALLALSSTPIHLLYNSALFKTLDDNTYNTFIVGPEFLQSNYTLPSADTLTSQNLSETYKDSFGVSYESYVAKKIEPFLSLHENYTANISSFKSLSTAACISVYATYYLSGHGNVILVVEDNDSKTTPVNVHRGETLIIDNNYINAPFLW